MQVCPNLDILVPALVDGGIDELEKRCNLTPGRPGLLAIVCTSYSGRVMISAQPSGQAPACWHAQAQLMLARS